MDTQAADNEARAAPGGERNEHAPTDHEGPAAPKQPKLRTRKCRVCYDEVVPTYEDASFLDQVRGKPPRKIYYSEEDGHLISPCLCKGSVKYVHEACLQQWRYANVGGEHARKCPSCKYEYQLSRVAWAKWVRSRTLAFVMAVAIVITMIFILGFMADPIVSLWLDPVATLSESVGLREMDPDLKAVFEALEEDEGWIQHFLKGTTALGLLGFVKAFLAMSPWHWWNLRTTGIVGGTGRRGGTGRERMQNVSLALVVIGVFTFFWVSVQVSGTWLL